MVSSSRPAHSFMSRKEFRSIRTDILRVTINILQECLVSPVNGRRVGQSQITQWETGVSKIPLWAARKMRALAEAARHIDRGELEELE